MQSSTMHTKIKGIVLLEKHKEFLPCLFLILSVVIADFSLSPLAAQCRFSDLLATRLQTLAFIHFTEVGKVWARVRNYDKLFAVSAPYLGFSGR